MNKVLWHLIIGAIHHKRFHAEIGRCPSWIIGIEISYPWPAIISDKSSHRYRVTRRQAESSGQPSLYCPGHAEYVLSYLSVSRYHHTSGCQNLRHCGPRAQDPRGPDAPRRIWDGQSAAPHFIQFWPQEHQMHSHLHSLDSTNSSVRRMASKIPQTKSI